MSEDSTDNKPSARDSPTVNLLKIKNWRDPVELSCSRTKGRDVLKCQGDIPSGWEDKGDRPPEQLSKEIEPWLTALFQSEHLSLLVGSGLTTAIHRNVTEASEGEARSPNGFGNCDHFPDSFNEHINDEAERTARASGRIPNDSKFENESKGPSFNLEDQLRAAGKLLQGLKILTGSETSGVAYQEIEKKLSEDLNDLKDTIEKAYKGLINGVLASEKVILGGTGESKDERAHLNQLLSFLMSFASRSGTRDRLQLFTTNYDRVLELGAELAGIRLLDRFTGSLAPIFRSSRLDVDMHYNPPGIRGEPRYLEGVARFTKLHGSLDWVFENRNVLRKPLPFGAESFKPYIGSKASNALIYPNDAKDWETAGFPYVELFRDFAAAACRPNSTLVTYGYGFGDDHINRVIRDMLTIPSTHLVILAHADSGGRLSSFLDSCSNQEAQTTYLIGNHLGDLENLVRYYLPKPAIDRATIRMSELLKARGWSPDTATGSDKEEPSGSDEKGGSE